MTGADVLRLAVRWLPELPSPWRLRLAFGEVEIDATSTRGLEPRGWNGPETLAILAAALERRITGAQAERAAAGRVRLGATKPATWDQISGGLYGVDPATVPGTVGEALELLGARLVGAWSGDEANVTEAEHGEAKQGRRRRVRGVRSSEGGSASAVPPVPRRRAARAATAGEAPNRDPRG